MEQKEPIDGFGGKEDKINHYKENYQKIKKMIQIFPDGGNTEILHYIIA